jgi:AraC-like DNA-binding protein
MGVIATLLPNAIQIKRLRTAIRDRHELVACDDWETLMRVCERQAVRLAMIDLFAHGRANFEHVRQLKQRLPRLTLIAYVTFSPDRTHDVFDAGRQGMSGLVIVDQDDSPRALLALVEQAESRSLSSVVAASLTNVDPAIRDAALLAVTRAHERISPEDLARLLALPRRTVSQRLATAGFPPPQRLLTWGRLIVAAHLLEDRHRSADRVAAALDFPSGSAFRNTCQRYLHAAPHEIRARGGAAYVIRAMLRQTGVDRDPGSSPRTARRRLALAV